jgi:hypothetical protein
VKSDENLESKARHGAPRIMGYRAWQQVSAASRWRDIMAASRGAYSAEKKKKKSGVSMWQA